MCGEESGEGRERDGMRETERERERERAAESTVIMFGLGLPAGSFPLRSQEECEECCRRRKKKEGAEERGRKRDDDVKEGKSQEGEGGGGREESRGIRSEMKIERGRQEDEGRVDTEEKTYYL